MDISTCIILGRYNQAANTAMNLLIGKLDDSQWNAELGGYFKSIKEVCNHLYISDFVWLKRLSKSRDFDYIKDPLFDQELIFGTQPLSGIADYLPKREVLDHKILHFTTDLIADDLGRTLSYSDSKGVPHTRNFGGLVLHMFNHQTHHRAMISVYLDIMKIDNDYSNLLYIV